ncbi:MAG TPA: M15 family metallopeptidase [Candidatus Wunengus sp. YC61]|uniref:M15 family metallopeptidase n=1 Tax=Candidatus Wunengus sp. YC61 TaxID=3367698 RepID=UPI004026BCA2
MPSRKIEDLTLETQEKYNLFQEAMKSANMPFKAETGVGYIITQTRRTLAEQVAYYAQGRQSLNVVNELRKEVHLAPITEQENKYKVTNTMHSKHIEGKAFDIAMLKDGKVLWSNYLFDRAGPVGESVGLVWGGRFKNSKGQSKPDRPHFQIA